MNANVVSMIIQKMKPCSLSFMYIIYGNNVYIKSTIIPYTEHIHGLIKHTQLPKWALLDINNYSTIFSYYHIYNIPNLQRIKNNVYNMKYIETFDLTTFPNLKELDCSFRSGFTLHEQLNLTHLRLHNSTYFILPNTYLNLTYLDCSNTSLSEIPNTFINLKKLNCNKTNIHEIPNTFIQLTHLYCGFTPIHELPKTLTRLECLNCQNTSISHIPHTYFSLKKCICCYTSIIYIPSTCVNLKFLHHTKVVNVPITCPLHTTCFLGNNYIHFMFDD